MLNQIYDYTPLPSRLPRPLVFQNVSSNIICSRIDGQKETLHLNLLITPENERLCDIAYHKTGRLKVTVEVEE